LIATCAEILGVKLPETAGEDSVSILPALLGVDRKSLREAVVHHSIDGKFAIRQGNWKLEFCPGSGGWGKPRDAEATQQGRPSVQLYDLAADIGETKNLATDYPQVVVQLTGLMERYIDSGRSTPGRKLSNDVEISLTKTDMK
jgi:arylsulfatase A-like enzyme